MKIFEKILILGLFLTFCLPANAKDSANIYEVARDVPSKKIYGEAGNAVKLSDFKDDFVIAVFWSRFCFPCLSEMESLAQFAEKTKNDGIRVILISPKDEWKSGFAEQRRFLKKFKANNLEIYVDNKEDLTAALGIFTSPVSVLVSRKGQEIGRIRGSVTWDRPEIIEYMYKIKAENG